MYSFTTTLLVVALLCVLVPNVAAFGAGDIPDYAYLNDKAFRHGDIESILSQLSKNVGSSGFGGGVAGILVGVAKAALRGGKGDRFTSLDVKRVYFGNWLRDYSQAMDIAGLSKLTAQSLITVVSVLGFMTFGFATEEFEITADRLGVYLPVEHIDNPKGYAEKEGDARQFHPKLRPPVDNRELEIDQNTGMKNYIATEGESWDTSTAHIRRTLQACIERGRKANGLENSDMWEAFRLLGTALHTLEDLLAHSNWCELGLLKMGHSEVFCHVGDNVKVNSPNGSVPPLITGTFGSADFMHSMLGEATDHLSEASVSDLSKKMSELKNQDQSESPIAKLRAILGRIPSSGGDQQGAMDQGDQIRAKAFDFNPDDVAPEEVQQRLLEVLKWHDQVMHDITKTVQNIPGLESLLQDLTNAMAAYVYTTLEPWLTPILQQSTGALQEGSAAVIDSDDQYEVFNNPDASDPSHSLLSKDHFGLILNEPAGKIAMVVVKHTVELIVEAWYDHNKDIGATINQVLEAFHHPHYASGNSRVQNEMYEELTRWFGGLGESEGQQTIQLLTKDSVREGKNKRIGSEDSNIGGGHGSHGHGGQSGGYGGQSGGHGGQSGGYGGQSGGYGEQESESYGGRHSGGYGGNEESGRSGYGDNSQSTYGRHEDTYGNTEESSYGGGYGRSNDEYGSRSEEPRHTGYNPSYGGGDGGYSSRRDDNEGRYGSRRDDDEGAYSSRRSDNDGGYSSRRHDDEGGYGSRHNDDEGEHGGGYGSRRNNEEEGYGSRHGGGYNPSYGGGGDSYGGREEHSYGGGYGGGRRDDDTFGAERLNLNDDNEGYGSSRRHQGYNPDY
ncbi:hypothetical protein RSOLAG1IB_06660 [Rhizoctonia solani AG-1 IB]|uniref:Uncharacterized protein n=1 Tax=Thanatephorus cucumeris (strain AG1-IB / isolate 7/3/14) TaxID=1108050 RepID=A0A0B7FCE7_THACB|nr:hypothetical protein RSOLAG1IB_06660 [Rhizoctonia solani AG-1 IB]